MPNKPTTAGGYSSDFSAQVRSACLYLATKLDDLWDDLVVVGGLVPSLLVSDEGEPHVGTQDIDLGLQVALLSDERYQALTARLRQAGFQADQADEKIIRQRWKLEGAIPITIDFLIAPTEKTKAAGRLLNLEPDFAAIVTPGLQLAFQDKVDVTLVGLTIKGEQAIRTIGVCGPGAYVVLKALAFRSRGENKDAYDLFYVLSRYGDGIQDVITRMRPLLEAEETQRALQILREDFLSAESVGAKRVAEFLGDRADDNLRADVAGAVNTLLHLSEII